MHIKRSELENADTVNNYVYNVRKLNSQYSLKYNIIVDYKLDQENLILRRSHAILFECKIYQHIPLLCKLDWKSNKSWPLKQ